MDVSAANYLVYLSVDVSSAFDVVCHVSIRNFVHGAVESSLVVDATWLFSCLVKLFVDLKLFLLNWVAARHWVFIIFNDGRINLIFNLKIQHFNIRTLFINPNLHQLRCRFLRLWLITASDLLHHLAINLLVIYDPILSNFNRVKISEVNRLILI